MIMLAGLPLISLRDTQQFRHYINTALGQHVHVAATEIPQWVEVENEEDMKVDFLGAVTSNLAKSDKSLGTFLFIVRPDFQATIMTLTGGCCYHVGEVECDSKEGCVFLVNFSRGPSDTFMGGTLCILDVFSFDGINYASKPYTERSLICRFLHRSVSLPSRFRMVAATQISGSKRIAPESQTFILLK
jgi:hypothetical protein